MILRSGGLRRQLDELRRRFDRESSGASGSVEEATEALAGAIDRHFAKTAASRVTADRLVAALDVIPQGIVLANGEGDIVFRNQTATEYLAARHGDALVGSLITELIDLAIDGSTTTRTIELFGPPRRSLELRSVPIDEHLELEPAAQMVSGAFVVVEDVTERQWIEAVRRDFVANISHELKTPVGALGLLAETLADETDPEVARPLAHRLQSEAFRLSRTIDDLLQLSQIEAGEPPVREQVPVVRLMADVADRARASADFRNVDLVLGEVEPGLRVEGDRRQLVSALTNLVDNAAKYSDPGATVEVAAAFNDGCVVVEVRDQGIGIPARDAERIFERFYRVDRARSRDTGGTGLGLAIVRHVATNHGGTVTVSSREGEGSTFFLRLPAPASPSSPNTEES